MFDASQRSFHCPKCSSVIYIPHNLPPTQAPCPHCNTLIVSPPLPTASVEAPAQHSAAPPAYQNPHPTQATPAPMPQPVQQVQVPVVAAPVSRPNPPVPAPVTIPLPKQPARMDSTDTGPDQETSKSSAVSWIVALVLLGVLTAAGFFLYQQVLRKAPPSGSSPIIKADDPKIKAAEYARDGWKREATQTLSNFISAKTLEEKSRYVIGGRETMLRLEKLYGPSIMDETETPADAFVAMPLGDEDLSRNIYLMAYDRPAQFEMSKFFRPLASIEVQQGLNSLDPLTESITHVSNFAMEPMKIQAFFKKTDQGMLLDWDVYLQTRHRNLKRFMENAKPGQSGVFRTLIVEDVPLAEDASNDLLVYRIGDPAHMVDTYRLGVPRTSPIAMDLAKINWRGTKNITPNVATVTLELTVSDLGTPSVKRFVCWEFEGLGGGAGAVDQAKHSDTIPQNAPLEEDLKKIR